MKIFKNGDVYEGDFKNDIISGNKGIIDTLFSGERFTYF